MATLYWRGGAPAVAQVDTLTPSNVEAGDVFTATINGKSVSYTAVGTSPSVADVVAGLVSAWNASTIPEFMEITATDSTTHVTLTADTAGKPFTVTAAATDGGGTDDQDLTQATTTANSGPYCWDTVANWWTGSAVASAIPVTGDTVIFENNNVSCLYGLAQSAVTLVALHFRASYTGYVGLPRTANSGASNQYHEYRATYLAISATSVIIGDGPGSGSGRIKLNTGLAQTEVLVKDTGTTAETNVPAVLWKGVHSSNAIKVDRGTAGIGFFSEDGATVGSVTVGEASLTTDSEAEVTLGLLVTATLVYNLGGTVTVPVDCSITQYAGTCYVTDDAAITALTLYGGTCYYDSDGTCTAAHITGTIDFRRDARAKTFTSVTLYNGYAWLDPSGRVTVTNGWDFSRCGPQDGTFQIGDHQTLTASAI